VLNYSWPWPGVTNRSFLTLFTSQWLQWLTHCRLCMRDRRQKWSWIKARCIKIIEQKFKSRFQRNFCASGTVKEVWPNMFQTIKLCLRFTVHKFHGPTSRLDLVTSNFIISSILQESHRNIERWPRWMLREVTWGSKLTSMKLVSSSRTISGWARLKLQASSTPATHRW